MKHTFISVEWFDAYIERVNNDPELAAIGRWFNASWFLIADQTRKVIKVEAGKITEVVHAPRIDTRAVFGFRAPVERGRNLSVKSHHRFTMIFLQCSCGCQNSRSKAKV